MDVEQLKVMMETMSGLGDNAMYAFVAFLMVQLLPKIMGWGVAAYLVSTIIKCVKEVKAP